MDREKVKAELDEIVEQCRGMDYIGFSTITEHCQNILALLKEQEAEIEQLKRFVNGFSRDAMPVVRCKDCKHYAGNGWCNRPGINPTKHDDWFCADGERKT